MSKLDSFTREEMEALDKERLIDLIIEMHQHLAQMATHIQKLEDQIAKNSSNSGKPPSSDGLRKKPAPKSLRRKGQRQSGGQAGHEGHTLTMVEAADYVNYYPVEECPYCQTHLTEVAVERIEKRQVFDVPEPRLEVAEHQAEIKSCPNCGEVVKAAFPEEVTQAVQYGTRIKAQMVYLNSYQLLPMARTVEVLGDFYGHVPSEALVQAANDKLAERVTPVVESVKQNIIEATVVHSDESGMIPTAIIHMMRFRGAPIRTKSPKR